MRLVAHLLSGLALLWALSAHAADQARVEAAEDFFAALQKVDADQQIKQAVDEMLRRDPQDAPFRLEYEKFFREVMSTPEYRAAKVRAYSETFTEDELRLVTQLVQQPGYRVLAMHFVEISNANKAALKDALSPRVEAFSRHIQSLRDAAVQSARRLSP